MENRIFNIVVMLAIILGKKVAQNHLGMERILCAEIRIKVCHRLGGEAGHADGRRVPLKKLRN